MPIFCWECQHGHDAPLTFLPHCGGAPGVALAFIMLTQAGGHTKISSATCLYHHHGKRSSGSSGVAGKTRFRTRATHIRRGCAGVALPYSFADKQAATHISSPPYSPAHALPTAMTRECVRAACIIRPLCCRARRMARYCRVNVPYYRPYVRRTRRRLVPSCGRLVFFRFLPVLPIALGRLLLSLRFSPYIFQPAFKV